jgi:uncharacterized protein YicC (UPF0701 family)
MGSPPSAINALLDAGALSGVVRDADRDLAPVAAEALVATRRDRRRVTESRRPRGRSLARHTARSRGELRERVATVRARLPEVRARIQSRTAERAAQLMSPSTRSA